MDKSQSWDTFALTFTGAFSNSHRSNPSPHSTNNVGRMYREFLPSLNVAKCNLGKVNLELMPPAVSLSLHMICGGAPLEFAVANYVHPCFLAIVAINAFVSESLRIHGDLPAVPELPRALPR